MFVRRDPRCFRTRTSPIFPIVRIIGRLLNIQFISLSQIREQGPSDYQTNCTACRKTWYQGSVYHSRCPPTWSSGEGDAYCCLERSLQRIDRLLNLKGHENEVRCRGSFGGEQGRDRCRQISGSSKSNQCMCHFHPRVFIPHASTHLNMVQQSFIDPGLKWDDLKWFKSITKSKAYYSLFVRFTRSLS